MCYGLKNNDDIHSIFAQRFKELRLSYKLSMRQTTNLLSLKSSRSIGAFESGHYPSVETLIKISNLFNVSLDYLIGCTENDIHHQNVSIIEQLKEITNNKHKSELACYKKEIEFYKKQIRLISKAVDLCKSIN